MVRIFNTQFLTDNYLLYRYLVPGHFWLELRLLGTLKTSELRNRRTAFNDIILEEDKECKSNKSEVEDNDVVLETDQQRKSNSALISIFS